MSARSRMTVSVTILPPDRLILKNWDDNEFLVTDISCDFYFHDGGFTRQRIQASGKRLKKDGAVGAVNAHSVWGQVFSREVCRQLQVAAQSIVKRAAKAEVPA